MEDACNTDIVTMVNKVIYLLSNFISIQFYQLMNEISFLSFSFMHGRDITPTY